MREIRVAYAGPDGIDEAIAASTRKIIGEGYNLRFYSTVYAQELLETAQNYDVHIFVLFLNSIAFPSGNSPAERRLEQALRLVIHLKARYRGAVIGLYAWPKEPYFSNRAKMAGADYVFKAPSEQEEFHAALEVCLEDVKREGAQA
jgi:hypothetical protein